MGNPLSAGLVDDAGLFPPTELSMVDALARNERDRAVAHPMLTDRFLIPSTRVDELLNVLPERQLLDVGLIHAGDGASLMAAIDRLGGRVKHLELKGTEALSEAPGNLAVYVEPPSLAELPAVIEAVTRLDRDAVAGVKIRCGGVRADLFPTVNELAAALGLVVSAGIPMKATAGLHNAVRHTDQRTGFEHHGFVNLLLGVGAALRGDGVPEVLSLRDERAVAERAAAISADDARAIRGVLQSYGSCSTSSPPQQAAALGIV